MPTIDELAPATSSSDTDEFIVSQSGIARKVTRAQVLNGYQATMTVPPGTLLGNTGTAFGAPGVVAVGQNLTFNGTTLSATAAPFTVATLPAGQVPATGDFVSMSQGGTNVAVTYGQFLSGMAGAANVNLSQALVTPSGKTAQLTLGSLAAAMLPVSGGTMSGSLMLSGNPTTASQAANKSYVDQSFATSLPLAGGSMSGTLTLAGAPQQTLDAATKGYADGIAASMVAAGGGSMSGALVLAGDPTATLQASTKHYTDQKVARSGDTLSGALILAADPVSALQAATKNYVDVQVATALPNSGGTLSGSLFLAADPSMSAQAATKQYTDQRILRAGDTMTGTLALAADPVAGSQAATKNYVDAKFGASVATTGASMTGALLLASDPATPLQASTKQYADLHVNRSGDSLTGALYLAGSPTAPSQAASKQYVDGQVASAISLAGGTFTGPVTLAADPVASMQAATKEYTDARILRLGDTMAGPLVLASDPTMPLGAATKNYVDEQVQTTLPKSGGSLTGALLLAANPTASTQAATKQYVDGQVAMALPLTGGSLAGILALASTPTSPAHAASKQYVDGQVATALPLAGGSLTGALALAGAPSTPMQAATKAYVDANPNAEGVINVKMPPYNAKIDGVTDDTAAFMAAYQAAQAGSVIYVPNGTVLLQPPATWGIALTKMVKWNIDGTVLSNGTPLGSAVPTGGSSSAWSLPGIVVGNTPSGATVSQGSSQATDFAVTQSAYIVSHNGGTSGTVATNSRADTIIYDSPGNFIWGGLDRMVWAGTQTPNAATPAQHVARYVQTVRQALSTNSSGQVLPQPQLWAACIEYHDTTGAPSSQTQASLTAEMDWFGNGADDANCRAIQSLVIGQHNTSGAAVEVSSIIGVWLGAGSTGSAKNVISVNIPFSNAILDASYSTSVNNAPVIRMQAGQAISFDIANSHRLLYDVTTGTLRFYQGTLSYAVGKGISVGWGGNYSASTTLPSYLAGNMILLTGSGTYTITLPAANAVAAGVGFTFSVTGSASVSIQTAGSDAIDSGPITLNPDDRYHIVSDGTSTWREVFWTNAVTPRFRGPMVLASYTVTALPSGVTAGAKAFATNGRKPTEGAGSGTGVEVFFDGLHWISSCSGSAVAA